MQPEPSPGSAGTLICWRATSDAGAVGVWSEAARPTGTAPRRSELRRSGDYSGPSAFPACAARSSGRVPVPCRTPPVPCTECDDLLRGLDTTQRDAVTSRAAPLAILAGAGSGKTRVLTRRIAWQSRERIVDPRHVLALTFTRKAAGELRTRLGRLGVEQAVTAGTFHAIALAQLRRRAEDEQRTMPTLLERKVRLLVPLVNVRGREAGLRAAELASEIEWAKARLVRPDGYEQAVTLAGAHSPAPAAEVAEIYREYEREKRRRGLVDFDDLITGCADVLERDANFAAAQRWRFRHLFVDEFQDASPAQFRLLRSWLGDRSDLCVVGDGDQAIYGFAGADPTFLVRFTAQFPPERFPDVGVVRLGSNYRSTPQVVAAAGAVLGSSRRRTAERAARPEGPAPVVTAYDTDDDEARSVARAVRAAHASDVPWSRIAVLYRVNAQSALFEEAFSRAGVPFRVRGGGRFLERPEVKVALDACRSRRERPRAARSPSTSPISVVHRRRAVRGAARAHRRGRAPRPRIPRCRGRPGRRARVAVGVGRRFPRVPPDRAARRRRRASPVTTPSSCSRSTGRRASSSTRCSSPVSSAASCRSPTPRRPRRSTRNSVSSMSR